MFELYQHRDDRLEWLAECETDMRSRLLAIMLSKQNGAPVLVVENLTDGRTLHRYTFENGQPKPTGGFKMPLPGGQTPEV